MEINVNDYVWVRLTAHGEDILQQQHRELLDGLPEAARRVVGPYTPLERDADGWSKVQIWKLMGCFGAHMYNGCEMPFKTTIRVNKVEPDTPENLNEVPPERPGGDQQNEETPPAASHTFLHRQFFPVRDESLHSIPAGATHYRTRHLIEGPTVDFWGEDLNCPNCGYPDRALGGPYKGIYVPGEPCDHCGYEGGPLWYPQESK